MQAKPCRPRASTALPNTHVWVSHALHPSLCATAILISSSDSRSPTDVIGGAASQSPECGDDAANSLALSLALLLLLLSNVDVGDPRYSIHDEDAMLHINFNNKSNSKSTS